MKNQNQNKTHEWKQTLKLKLKATKIILEKQNPSNIYPQKRSKNSDKMSNNEQLIRTQQTTQKRILSMYAMKEHGWGKTIIG